jgi:hypothetical protein
MSDAPHIRYTPWPGVTQGAERAALSNVYSFVLSRANKNAAGVSSTNGGDAMKGSKNDRAGTSIRD